MDLNNINNMLFSNKKFNINGFEQFIDNFGRRKLVHIFGDFDSGKTSLALDIISKNSDKVFIYIDTYFDVCVAPDNCFVIHSNDVDKIISILNLLPNDCCDCLIIDSYSNLNSSLLGWNDCSYEIMSNILKDIINIAYKKNMAIILLNTLNGKDKAFNRNNFLRINSICEIQLLKYNYEHKYIIAKSIKSNLKINQITKIFLKR